MRGAGGGGEGCAERVGRGEVRLEREQASELNVLINFFLTFRSPFHYSISRFILYLIMLPCYPPDYQSLTETNFIFSVITVIVQFHSI